MSELYDNIYIVSVRHMERWSSWFMAPVLKIGVGLQPTVGSNPTLSAIFLLQMEKSKIFTFATRLSYLGLCRLAKQDAHVAKPLFLYNLIRRLTQVAEGDSLLNCQGSQGPRGFKSLLLRLKAKNKMIFFVEKVLDKQLHI